MSGHAARRLAGCRNSASACRAPVAASHPWLRYLIVAALLSYLPFVVPPQQPAAGSQHAQLILCKFCPFVGCKARPALASVYRPPMCAHGRMGHPPSPCMQAACCLACLATCVTLTQHCRSLTQHCRSALYFLLLLPIFCTFQGWVVRPRSKRFSSRGSPWIYLLQFVTQTTYRCCRSAVHQNTCTALVPAL